jgi:hypothetical protein
VKHMQYRSLIYILNLLLLWLPLRAQSGLDITGRASFNVKNVTYDEQSKILPDSIDKETYCKTILIPGLQQGLNMALFGRTADLDITLLADLKNNTWNSFDIKNPASVSRLTFDLHIRRQELVLGDFFESGSDLFIKSREIRGGRFKGEIDHIFGPNSYIAVRALGGIVQHAVKIGEHAEDLYRIYETTGQYSRTLAAGSIQGGQKGLFDLTFNYLIGRDDKNSVSETIYDPLANNIAGGAGTLYLWDKKIKLFGEYNWGRVDTLTAAEAYDYAYRAGSDLRLANFKLVLLYQRLGCDYLSFGYPFLENDKQGTLGQIGYTLPNIVTLFSDFEIYQDNLNRWEFIPTANTYLGTIGFTTNLTGIPEFTIKYGQRLDKSKKIFDPEGNPLKTMKETQKIEGRIGYKFDNTRLSLSAIQLEMDDQSLVSVGTPLGTEQFITSANFYSRVQTYLFFSGGAVYSRLEMTDKKTNENIYLYETTRWDILPCTLRFENTLTFIANSTAGSLYEAENMLGNFIHLIGEVSLEYFFTSTISFKIIAGTDSRRFDYTEADALRIIADPQYGPIYFNGQESYEGLILGGELNWMF